MTLPNRVQGRAEPARAGGAPGVDGVAVAGGRRARAAEPALAAAEWRWPAAEGPVREAAWKAAPAAGAVMQAPQPEGAMGTTAEALAVAAAWPPLPGATTQRRRSASPMTTDSTRTSPWRDPCS